MGNILAILGYRANIHDTKSGIIPAIEAVMKYPTLQRFCADKGFRKTFVNDVQRILKLGVDISERIKPIFEIEPKRWRIERTISWFNGSRELSKDYEISVDHEENMIWISHMSTLLKKLA
jgi:hypothetical protein